jgi:hypothetical protein
MAQNIFDATLDVNNEIKVNTFDWSHANNLTTQIGRVTPIFCDLLPAKSSFRVNPRIGLQFMPMVFPIQTRMKARVMFFKYPLRALWKGYRDFVGNFRQDLEEPYLDFNTAAKLKAMASTGSLGDYLGLPTTIFGKYGQGASEALTLSKLQCPGNMAGGDPDFSYFVGLPIENVDMFDAFVSKYKASTPNASSWNISLPAPNIASSSNYLNFGIRLYKASATSTESWNENFRIVIGFSFSTVPNYTAPTSEQVQALLRDSFVFSSTSDGATQFTLKPMSAEYTSNEKAIVLTYAFGEDAIEFFKNHVGTKVNIQYYLNVISGLGRKVSGSNTAWSINTLQNAIYRNPPLVHQVVSTGWSIDPTFIPTPAIRLYDYSDKPADITLDNSPYYNSNKPAVNQKQIKISAYAARAYEGIYNCYIRDNRNNPYYVDGVVQYNQWIPTYEGGIDDNLYELRYANWERDFLTTAVQSPQQGTAPLVGLTTYTETVNEVSEDGTPITRELAKMAIVDEDGKRYSISWDSDESGLQGVEYTELDNGVKLRQPRNLIDVATSGISISDLRNVNAYQKFLELNMRKGYSYRDIVEGRFDVKVRYDDLLMPEFFGGFSRDVDMHAISQSVDQNIAAGAETYAGALGSQAGVAGVRGDSNQNIECFCDEESIIMGLLVITPLPVYTQLLPKHFTYRGLLDHYQPEFNHIGFQPITYKEVCPVQAYNSDPNSLNTEFGYNRPWYEYCQKYDQAHGLFRTNLSNFLMHRVFNNRPALSQQFLVIDPEQVTDVFAVTKADDGTDLSDKIYGQVFLDCTVKLPISRVAIPRLD